MKFALPACLGGFILLTALSARGKSAVYDEPFYLDFGKSVLRLEFPRQHAGPLPVSALNAAAFLLAEKAGVAGEGPLWAGRMATVLVSAALAWLVFAWALQIYGRPSAWLALGLFCLSPTVIAHSRLITSDAWAMASFAFAVYCFRGLVIRGGWARAAACALVTGAALLTKYTCLLIYPVFILILLGRWALGRREDWWLRGGLRRAGALALIFLAGGILILNLGFAFSAPAPRSGYLLPGPYLEGIETGRAKEANGEGFGYMYLMGELRKTGGFRSYYFWAFLFKVPIPFILVLGLALGRNLSRPRGDFAETGLFLTVPALFLIFYFSFFVRVNLGIRYLLPVFPFLSVYAGSFLAESGKARKLLAAVLLGLQAVSLFSWHPHYLSYFNEMLRDRRDAYLLLADSNLDWGQNDHYLARYLRKHPETRVNPLQPVSGRIAVSANHLVGIWEPGRFAWLRENFRPAGHVAYSWLIFEVDPADLEKLSRTEGPR